MRAHAVKFAMAALLAWAALGLTGCKPAQSMTDEMRNQEVIMTSEANDWQASVSAWRSQHEEMIAGYDVLQEGRDSAVAHDRIEEINEHAENVSVFQASLEEHQAALAVESKRSENDRVPAHAGLWAEHQRLKGSYTMLAATHEDLMKAYAELRGGKA